VIEADPEPVVVRRKVGEEDAREEIRRHLARPGPFAPDAIARAEVKAIEPLVAPYWALRATGTCRWTARAATVSSLHDGDSYVRDEDLDWSDEAGELPMTAEIVVPAGVVEAIRPSCEQTRSKRRGEPDREPLPTLVSAEEAWERGRGDAEQLATREAWLACEALPTVHRRETGPVTHAWGAIDARLVLHPIWRVELTYDGGPFTLWVDGDEGSVSGELPQDPAKVQAYRAENEARAARERVRTDLLGLVLAIATAGAVIWWFSAG
jgi:hypothetical protein